MHHKASSATFRREDGPGVFQVDARPGHCLGGNAHRWRFHPRSFEVEINGVVLDRGEWMEERCERCGSIRPFEGGRLYE